MATTGVGFFYDGVMAGREVKAGLSRRSAATRPLPLEDLCFFVKPIDNSRLIKVVDPKSRRECMKLVLTVAAVFGLLLLYMVPYLWMRRSGYRIGELKKHHEEMVESNRLLQVKQAELRSLDRIEAIARKLGMQAPAPEQVVWSDGGRPAADLLARNARK